MIARLQLNIALLLFAWLLCASVGKCQQPAVGEAKKPVPAHAFQDTNKCIDCHERELRRSNFLGESAASVWRDYDKHRDAFRLLYMGKDENDVVGAKEKQLLVRRILGFDLREAFADDGLTTMSSDPAKQTQVATVRSCLNCHATWPQESSAQHPPIPLAEGVSCQACHGPGLKWTDPHAYPWWRLVTPAGKQSLGFKDIRDPAERARLCASCHVGNHAEGKFVTHAWYAGGHPPLSGFEYSTYADQMPVHWRSLADKTQFVGKEANNAPPDRGVEQRAKLREFLNTNVPEAEVRASYREANFPLEQFGQHDPFTDLPRLKETVISGMVVLETYTRLVKEQALAAQREGPAKAGTPASWPEFAIYDCASCHHELRSGPGYPQRPFGKHPIGRPPAQIWPAELARLGVLQSVQFDPQAAVEPLARFDQARANFEQAITASVFGKPAEVATTAEALQTELATTIERLQRSRYDKVSARSALLYLSDASQVETRDYHSARQLAWAIREIFKDYNGLPYRRATADPAGIMTVEQLFDVRSNPNQPGVDILRLKLPATQQQSIIEHQRESFSAITNFDSAAFAKRLAELHSRLQELPSP
jgi:hypothetical protein